MKFSELPQSSKDEARKTLLGLLISMDVKHSESMAKGAGEYVAAAFIAMEHYDSAPDICDDGTRV